MCKGDLGYYIYSEPVSILLYNFISLLMMKFLLCLNVYIKPFFILAPATDYRSVATNTTATNYRSVATNTTATTATTTNHRYVATNATTTATNLRFVEKTIKKL